MSKNCFLFLMLWLFSSCSQTEEVPLILPAGAEPSARSYNNFGIEDFRAGQYHDAFLNFKQAYAADPYAGEIYFNIGLTLHMKGEQQKAIEMFQKARKYARRNPEILFSKILKSYLIQKLEHD